MGAGIVLLWVRPFKPGDSSAERVILERSGGSAAIEPRLEGNCRSVEMVSPPSSASAACGVAAEVVDEFVDDEAIEKLGRRSCEPLLDSC
jgi:hypothetical protein